MVPEDQAWVSASSGAAVSPTLPPFAPAPVMHTPPAEKMRVAPNPFLLGKGVPLEKSVTLPAAPPPPAAPAAKATAKAGAGGGADGAAGGDGGAWSTVGQPKSAAGKILRKELRKLEEARAAEV